MRVRWMIIMLVWALLPATAQNVQELQKQQKVLQKQLQETKEMLKQTKKDETATENKLNLLNEDINTRKELIVNIQDEITALDGEMTLLTQERDSLQVKLEEAKADYAKLIRETHMLICSSLRYYSCFLPKTFNN